MRSGRTVGDHEGAIHKWKSLTRKTDGLIAIEQKERATMTAANGAEPEVASVATHLGRPCRGPNRLKITTITAATTDLLGDLTPAAHGTKATIDLRDHLSTLGISAANATLAANNGTRGERLQVPRERLANAMADVLMAMAQVAAEHGIDLAEATAERFNEVAVRGGHRLRLPRVTGPKRVRYDEEKWTSRLADMDE